MEIQLKYLNQCLLCESPERKSRFTLGPIRVFLCLSCGLSYIDPCLDPSSMIAAYESSVTLRSLHEFHGSYYEYGNLNEKSRTRLDFERILSYLEGQLPVPRGCLYEVGFGNGYFLALAKKHGWEVQGIDSSSENAGLAKEKFNLDLQSGQFQNCNVDDKRYSVVVMLDLIEHQDDPLSFIKKAHGLLEKEGYLVLACPNEQSFMKMLGSMIYRLTGGRITYGLDMIFCWEHLACYNLKTLSFLLRQGSFEPVFSFFTSTDLKRYHFKPLERLLAHAVLTAGKILNQQNRVVVIGKKIGD